MSGWVAIWMLLGMVGIAVAGYIQQRNIGIYGWRGWYLEHTLAEVYWELLSKWERWLFWGGIGLGLSPWGFLIGVAILKS